MRPLLLLGWIVLSAAPASAQSGREDLEVPEVFRGVAVDPPPGPTGAELARALEPLLAEVRNGHLRVGRYLLAEDAVRATLGEVGASATFRDHWARMSPEQRTRSLRPPLDVPAIFAAERDRDRVAAQARRSLGELLRDAERAGAAQIGGYVLPVEVLRAAIERLGSDATAERFLSTLAPAQRAGLRGSPDQGLGRALAVP